MPSEDSVGDTPQELFREWTPLTADYLSPAGKFTDFGEFRVVFTRYRDGEWEFGLDRIDEREFESVEVFGSD